MNRYLLLSWMVFVSLIVGCGDQMPENPQDNFHFSYQWIAGSVPPPGHYRYTIRMEPSGQATINYKVGYDDDDPSWTKSFYIDNKKRQRIYRLMVKNKLFENDREEPDSRNVGGTRETLTVVSGKREVAVPAHSDYTGRLEDLYEEIRELVPVETWTILEEHRDKWQEDYDSNK